MIKEYCDICGEELTNLDAISRYKVKKLDHFLLWGCRWERLTVHSHCWRNLARLVAQRKDKTID